ncbi:hypothetical protein IJ732_07420 [bacterium]|nr:hypothetical protein [bacterium]
MKISAIKPNINKTFKPVSAPISTSQNTGSMKNAPLISSAAASAIAAATLVNAQEEVNEKNILKKLAKIGYKESQYGTYKRNPQPQERLKLYEEIHGRGSDVYLDNVTYFTKENVKDFENFLNIDPKLGKKMFNKHFENLVNVFCNLKFNTKLQTVKDKNIYQMAVNTILNPVDAKTEKYLHQYKGKVYEEGIAKEAQKYLRGNCENPTAEVKDLVNKVSSYIDTQKIPAGTKLYRGERFYVLQDVKAPDGETINLAEMMKKASESNDNNEIKKVEDFINNKKGLTATQPAFMSTSANSNNEFERKDWIYWELETEPNTKGLYLESLTTSFYSFHDEVLLQKGSKIEIENAQYRNGIWYMKGKVSN